MSRIPASASVALAGLLPVCAAALGLGEVESKSYLNEPFSAEIPVFTEVASEIAGLAVSLAPAETFSQYGLQRPAFLGDLKFAVVPGPGGAVIRITSPQPVLEPFVTLLLEVRWPQGRLLREYTVLLDPPAFTGGAVRQPVQAPTAAAQPAPAPVAGEPAPARAPAGSAAPAEALDAGATHTVARNETLWGIADRYRPEAGADINQVMLAIYPANPDAFAGNINRLNAGAVLRIPDRGTIQGLRRSEATAEVQRQNSEWRGTAAAPEAAARLELVPPTEEAPSAAPPPAAAAGTSSGKLQAEVEESRRLVAVKDAELQALRKRVAELEAKGGGEVALETEQPAAAPVEAEAPVAAAPPPEQPAAVPEEPAAAPAAAKPVRARPPAGKETGIVGTILGLLTSIWLWIAAAVVLVAALLLARRRSAVEQAPEWRPTTRRGADAAEGTEARPRERDEPMIVIEEPGRPQATGGIERRAVPRRGDEELPLEKTISTDGPVNLDQSDPLAEADFHMAYGLYDQAADLLTAAVGREPGRRDLQLKLLDVYFVWENREGFLETARSVRKRIGNDADPDWKRVTIMGKQLCPTEAMFEGAAAPAADEMDLAFSDDSGGTMGLPIGGDGGLDFDLSGGDGLDLDADAPTKVARPWSSAQTQEIPTIEAPGVGSASTMETPTVESPDLSSTMSTPTIETPTVETWSPDGGRTARLQGMSEERSDQTEEIDLEDLGLDLTGLDDAARDMATGLQEALPDAGGGLDFDLSAGVSPGMEEPTEEMEKNPTLNNLTKAMGRGDTAGAPRLVDDTAEQRGITDAGATMSSQTLSVTSDELESLNIDLDLDAGSDDASDLTATGLRAIRDRRPEDPTMTEVGTKLDLARAYVDMGDPDGARSILNEVLEEGDPSQRQEARQLLDGLNS